MPKTSSTLTTPDDAFVRKMRTDGRCHNGYASTLHRRKSMVTVTTSLDEAVRKVFSCKGLTDKESAQVVLRHPCLIDAYKEEIMEAMNAKR